MTQRTKIWIAAVGVSLSMWASILLSGNQVVQLTLERATDPMTTASFSK